MCELGILLNMFRPQRIAHDIPITTSHYTNYLTESNQLTGAATYQVYIPGVAAPDTGDRNI